VVGFRGFGFDAEMTKTVNNFFRNILSRSNKNSVFLGCDRYAFGSKPFVMDFRIVDSLGYVIFLVWFNPGFQPVQSLKYMHQVFT